jgi:salicylate hydroxylase
LHIRIAGAGIAGLASAIALARAGHQVSVHEQASRIEEVGAGLQLGPNAVRALESLGAWQRLEPSTVAPAAIAIHDAASDRTLSTLPLGKTFERRFAAPYRVAHRADLLNALKAEAAALDGIEIHTGQRLTGLDLAEPEKPTLRFNGETLPCDLAIAADGIRSSARQAIAPHVSPRQTGDVLYRAMCPASALPVGIDAANVYMWLSPGAHAVAYSVSGGKRMNIVASVAGAAPVDGWNALATRDQVLSAFPSACVRLQSLLQEPANWLAWSAADLDPFDGWSKGHAVLVGDAAHATLPHLAQGAAMALEDAVELAAQVGDGTPSPPASPASRPPANRAPPASSLGSRAQGSIYKMTGPSALARNLVMKLLPASRQLERLAWIYEG